MRTIQKERVIDIPLHTTIVGKWNGNKYTITKDLGSGAIGRVYLAKINNRLVALKISDEENLITSEVNILKKIKVITDEYYKNMLIECDDWLYQGKNYYFYSMTYVDGEDLLTFIKRNGHEWLPVIMSQLLTQLEVLHSSGYIFGDLKPENIKIRNTPPLVRLLDVGGVTNIGRAVKQYTEFFDRGYWGLGSRRAEVTYDLFAAAMVMVNVIQQSTFTKKSFPREHDLLNYVCNDDKYKSYNDVIYLALKGKLKSAKEMRQHILTPKTKKRSNQNVQSKMSDNIKPKSSNMKMKRISISGVIETTLIILFLMLAYGFYIMGQ